MSGSRWVVTVLVAGACVFPFRTSVAAPLSAPAEYVYACREWSPSAPPVAVGLFDVFGGTGNIGDLGPSEDLRQTVLRAGGTIVHEFNIPAVRAELQVSRIPGLPEWYYYALSVDGDPNQYLVDAYVAFRAGVTETELEFLTSLGATVVEVLGLGAGYVEAIVPDEAIPAIRANPSVRYLEPNWLGCVTPAHPGTWGHLKSLYR